MKIKEVKGKIKVGNLVRVETSSGIFEGYVGEIDNSDFYVWSNKSRHDGTKGSIPLSTKDFKYSWEISWENEREIEILKSSNKFMNIREKFHTFFLSEPLKSFRKTGITDSNNELTDDGKAVFLSWLLNKHGEEFKTQVVDVLMKEEEEKKGESNE